MITIGFRCWDWSQLRGIIIFLIKWSDKWAHLGCMQSTWQAKCTCARVCVSFIPGNFYLAIILAVLWHAPWQSGWNILVRQAPVALILQMISSHILVDGNWFFIMASVKLFRNTQRMREKIPIKLFFQLNTLTIGTYFIL